MIWATSLEFDEQVVPPEEDLENWPTDPLDPGEVVWNVRVQLYYTKGRVKASLLAQPYSEAHYNPGKPLANTLFIHFLTQKKNFTAFWNRKK